MPASLLLSLLAAAFVSLNQADARRFLYIRSQEAAPVAPCRRENLSLKEGETDAAMGGVRVTDFIFTNTSSSRCTLDGYPLVELLSRKALVARRAVKRDQLPGDTEKMRPQSVTLEPGKSAWFRIHYNSGGAGYLGKPCPTYPKVRVQAPGTARPHVLRSGIQSCRGSEFEVSAVRSGTPQ